MTDTLRPVAFEDNSPSHAAALLPWPLVRALDVLAAGEGATSTQAFHTAFALVLRRFTGNDELLARVDGAADARGVRTLMEDATTFREGLRIVRDACEASDRMVPCREDSIALDILGASACALRGDATDDHLRLTLASDAHGLGASTAAVLHALAIFLHAVVATPDVPAGIIALTDEAQRERLLWRADGPRRPRRDVIALDRLVADRAAVAPDSVAVIEGSTRTTYRELVARAGSISSALRRRGIEPGQRVGVCMDVSADLFATILGVWSAGAVYVPLDPGLPPERLTTVARDAGIALAMVSGANARTVAVAETMIVEELAHGNGDLPASLSSSTGAAYIVYTSGSTGTPKGVEISHAAAANAILGACDVCAFDARDRTLCRSAISFDLSIYDIFCALVVGATLVVAPRAATGDPHATIDLVEAHAITHLLLGPALLAAVLERRAFERCTSLRVVTCGGEALSRSLVGRFYARSSATLFNLYGPSEAAMLVTLHRCSPSDAAGREASASLGRPLANTHVSVRDAERWPVPLGAIGEIAIGGAQIAGGYINRPDETTRRFVRDPARPGQNLYLTGDIARLQLDGSIVFLGRNDKQVKIRGNRVEPAEVVAAIERIAGVQTAVICVQRRIARDADDALVLVGYVLLGEGAELTPAGIRGRLRDTLPAFMVPIEIHLVAAFPLTGSGKIDERALAAGSYLSHERVDRFEQKSGNREFSLRGIVREQVRVIWESLLERTDIGDYDNFLDVGGDSLLAVRLMMRLEETFGRRVSFSGLFETMTIAAIATLIATDAGDRERETVTFNESGNRIPLIYLHGDFAGGSYAWTLAHQLGPDQPLTVVSPHGLPGRPVATNVSAMARDVAAAIGQLHPAGPLRIGGYSAAGLVAFETARVLSAAGRDVRDVLLVATSAENAAFRPLRFLMSRASRPNGPGDVVLRRIMSAGFALGRFVHMSTRRRLTRLGSALGIGLPSSVLAANEIQLGRDYAAYERAHAAYIPGAYDGKVTILWPAGEAVEAETAAAGWRRVAPRTEVVSVPGSHLGCVSRYLNEIADEIRRRFS